MKLIQHLPLSHPPDSIDTLLRRITELEAEVAASAARTAIVERNASALYRTARAELDRKDALIDQLQSELERERVKSRGRSGGGGGRQQH